jgi:hypothetical protein
MENIKWMLSANGGDIEAAKKDCVEGQLQTLLDPECSAYRVVSHAYDGFTTESVLKGDRVGRVFNINHKNSWHQSWVQNGHVDNNKMYLQAKGVDIHADSYFVHPLEDLKKTVRDNPQARHYVILSVGGNDFRERLRNPLAMLWQIPFIHQRYLTILKELKDLNVQPILMFQYRLDANNDGYRIYTIMRAVGVILSGISMLSIFGLGRAAYLAAGNKINQRWTILALISAVSLYVSTRFVPLNVTKDILKGQDIGLTTLGGLMERFYAPILDQAKKDKTPILDLPNTLNPNDGTLFISQIEPSKEGGRLIADGIAHIVKTHSADQESMIYAKRPSDAEWNAAPNTGNWKVAYIEKA